MIINSRRLAVNPSAYSRSKNAGLSSLLCSVAKSPGPADILVNTILTARLLVTGRLDLLPFGKSLSTDVLTRMSHSAEILRTLLIASFSALKNIFRPDTVVGTSETIKLRLSVCTIGIVGPLDMLEFGFRPAQYMAKEPEILFVK